MIQAKRILYHYVRGNNVYVDAIAKAFNLGDLKSFRKGDFILKRDRNLYLPLLARIGMEIQSMNPHSDRRKFEIREETHLDLQPLFEQNLAFLKAAHICEEKLIHATGGGYETPGGIKGYGIFLSSHSVQAFTKSESLARLTQVLEIIIDPTETAIPIDVMVKEYGYPNPKDLDGKDDFQNI